ncbi:hypothetical protein [Caenibius sp. WL]|uniref:hypothetical protein n=1 Tax=Caenibius sp. WL TaxID=2872646 RepID=UPI001C9A00E3|nr:hypothetical protein [Caenibius sp. WL]QZP06815.1 hypothetical protein K5X80_08745 [Caenibius sp. WL]
MTAPQSANPQQQPAPALSEAEEWQRAYEDALRSLRAIPDPVMFARFLDGRHLIALCDAIDMRGVFAVTDRALIRDLQLLGLVEAGPAGRFLTTFGMRVRRAAKECAL